MATPKDKYAEKEKTARLEKSLRAALGTPPKPRAKKNLGKAAKQSKARKKPGK